MGLELAFPAWLAFPLCAATQIVARKCEAEREVRRSNPSDVRKRKPREGPHCNGMCNFTETAGILVCIHGLRCVLRVYTEADLMVLIDAVILSNHAHFVQNVPKFYLKNMI